MRAAWLNEAGTGLRIVDQVRTLEVKAACSEIAEFHGCRTAELFLQ
jgi:hypothetical protein